MPFYHDDWLTLYQGDALSVLRGLPAEHVDAVITDPPYNSGAATLSAKQADPAQKYQSTGTRKAYPTMLGDGRDQRSFTLWCTLWLTECWRSARMHAPLLVFGLAATAFRHGRGTGRRLAVAWLGGMA